MEQEKVKYLIDIINNMDIKDKLRLAICMSQSKLSGLIYNNKEYYEKFDSMLKDIDEEYRNMGIGEEVIKKIIDIAKDMNRDIELEVFGNNPEIHLYEKMGFKVHYRDMILKI